MFFFTNFISAQCAFNMNNTSYRANSGPICGTSNTAFGLGTLGGNIDGGGNAATGYGALVFNTNGSNNVAMGMNALYSNTSGSNNVAHGIQSLYLNTSGGSNTALGQVALYNNIIGSYNVATGAFALFNNINGSYNIAIGDSAGYFNTGSSSGNVFIGHRAGMNETSSNKIYIGNEAAKTLLYGDFSSGQVLLGKPNATGYVFKGTRILNVLGGILADSIRLALSSDWADKVFDKDYKLKPLQELEQYISANKHLPGIPSASEVEANGVNVGDLETKLLEKIEELHLYILQQQKQIDKLKREVDMKN
jgi:hypothetical protein